MKRQTWTNKYNKTYQKWSELVFSEFWSSHSTFSISHVIITYMYWTHCITQYHKVVSLIKCYASEAILICGTACTGLIRKLDSCVISYEMNVGISITMLNISWYHDLMYPVHVQTHPLTSINNAMHTIISHKIIRGAFTDVNPG